MRIGPLEIGRVRAAAETAPRVAKERGASGTMNMDGWLVGSDYNRDLQGIQGLRTFDRMLRSDGAVREAYLHIVAPLLGATVEIEPASDEPEDLEVAEFVRRAYFEWPLNPFTETLRTTLLYLPQGFQVFEIVEQVVEAELTWTDPTTREETTAPRRQFVTWANWAHRRPETIYKWNAENGQLVSVTQSVQKAGNYEQIEIPAEQLVVFTNEKEGDEFTGLSILRSVYKAWWTKEVVEKVAAIAYERHGVGVPVAFVPEADRANDAVLDKLELMLASLRAGEFTYLVFPGPEANGTRDGFTLKIMSPEGGIPDFVPFLDYLRGDIKGGLLVRFSELGHGQTGARATGDTQSQVWYDALNAVGAYVCSVHENAIQRLVAKNYDCERCPRFVLRDIEARSLAEFAQAGALGVTSGAVEPDKSFREWYRHGIGAPDEDEPEESGEEIEDENQPGDDQRLNQERLLRDEEQRRQQEQMQKAVEQIGDELKVLAAQEVRGVRSDEGSFSDGVALVNRVLSTLDERDPPTVTVNVEPTPIEVKVESPHVEVPVTVQPADVHIQTQPPDIKVDVAAPNVTVEPPHVTVEAAPANVDVQLALPTRRVELNRDADGKIKNAVVKDV